MNITAPDPQKWDDFVRQHPRGHLLQLSAWGDLKSDYGWKPVRVSATEGNAIFGGAQLLLRKLPLFLGTLAYLPYGPVVDWHDETLVETVMRAVHQTAKVNGAAFLKIEPGFEVETTQLEALGFRESPQTVQPPRTVLVELADNETMLQRMNQMTRRNIRKSEKFEVEIREGSRQDVNSFNAILHETGERQDFGVHVPAYYEKAYDLFVPLGDAVLLMASYAGQDLAGVFVFKVGDQAWYLYGASSNHERQRMAAFGVQWAGIQWARDKGCKTYDMYGIPDENEAVLEAQFETRHDDLWGVYRFKRGWGGRVVRTLGTWDKIYHRPVYGLYQAYLKIRRQQA